MKIMIDLEMSRALGSVLLGVFLLLLLLYGGRIDDNDCD